MEGMRKERLDRGIKVRSDGIYAISGFWEMAYLIGPGLITIVLLLLLPLLIPPYWQRVLAMTGVYAILSIGFGFLANSIGLVCLGGALFVGVGGYLSGLLNATFKISIIFTIPLATVLGGSLCTLLLLPCLPLRGVYFAIVSFVYPLFVARLIAATGAFGGTEGIAGLDVFPNIWVGMYVIISVILILMFFLSRLVNYTDFGMVLRGIKDNEQAIRASGLSLTWHKGQAVFITSTMGCFAGAYLTHLYGWVGMSLFAVDFSILPLCAAVVGGTSSLVGPLLGAIILVPISEALRVFGTLRITFYAVLLVFFVVYWTEGLWEFIRRRYHQYEHWVRM